MGLSANQWEGMASSSPYLIIPRHWHVRDRRRSCWAKHLLFRQDEQSAFNNLVVEFSMTGDATIRELPRMDYRLCWLHYDPTKLSYNMSMINIKSRSWKNETQHIITKQVIYMVAKLTAKIVMLLYFVIGFEINK